MMGTSLRTVDLFLRPTDVLLFRDGRPFDAGESRLALGGLPFPQAIYGALRTWLMNEAKLDYDSDAFRRGTKHDPVFGSAKQPGSLRLMGPFLARCDCDGIARPVFATPRDVSVPKQMALRGSLSAATILYPDPTRMDALAWSAVEACKNAVPAGTLPGHQWTGGYVDTEAMEDYLTGSVSQEKFLDLEPFKWEERRGIAIDAQTKTAAKGMLYSTRFLRLPNDWGLACRLEWNDDDSISATLPGGRIRLGGESKTAAVESRTMHIPSPPIGCDGKIKLVLMTPAVFDIGWLSSKWAGGEWEGLSLVSAAIGKPLAVSGWDMARREPKPVRLAVPAGSVYYFQANGRFDMASFTGKYHFNESICDNDVDAKAGYGICAVGVWNQQSPSKSANETGECL